MYIPCAPFDSFLLKPCLNFLNFFFFKNSSFPCQRHSVSVSPSRTLFPARYHVTTGTKRRANQQTKNKVPGVLLKRVEYTKAQRPSLPLTLAARRCITLNGEDLPPLSGLDLEAIPIMGWASGMFLSMVTHCIGYLQLPLPTWVCRREKL